MKKLSIIALIALGVSLQTCNGGKGGDKASMADTSSGDPTRDGLDNRQIMSQETKTDGDSGEFMKQAAIAGMAEIELGKYAQKNGNNKLVKNFGAMMVRDHTKAGDELKELAVKKQLTLPSSLDARHQDHVKLLEKLSGKDFDRQYIQMMVQGHQEVADLFRGANQDRDAEVKSFALKTLPVIQMHLDSAKAISAVIK